MAQALASSNLLFPRHALDLAVNEDTSQRYCSTCNIPMQYVNMICSNAQNMATSEVSMHITLRKLSSSTQHPNSIIVCRFRIEYYVLVTKAAHRALPHIIFGIEIAE